MFDHKLVKVLDALTEGEQKNFSGFLHWYVRPSEQKVLLLLNTLTDRKLRKTTDKNALFSLLFPGQMYHAQELYTLYSDLFRYLRLFLAMEKIISDESQTALAFMEVLEEKGLGDVFQLEKNAFSRQWEKQPEKNGAAYQQWFRLHDTADRVFMKQQKRAFDPALQQKIDALDVFYFSTKLREACEVLNRHNIIGEYYQLRFVNEIEHFVTTNETLLTHPPVALYHAAWKMINTREEVWFDTFWELIQQNLVAFSKEEGRDLANYAMNFCIRKINTGEEKFLAAAFEIYRFQLDTGLIFRGKFLTQWDYKNIITVAIRLKKFDWAEAFIHDFKIRIEPAFRENAWNYNLANLYYEKGEYRRALRILQEVEFTDVFYALSAKSLLMKIYFEQEDQEAVVQHAETFKIYLNRNKKISPYQKQIHLNFIKYIKKAGSLKHSILNAKKKAQEIEKWKQKLGQETSIANIGWAKSVWEAME